MARAAVTAAVCLCSAVAILAEGKEVTIASGDGFPLRATWQSAGKSGPGVLLLQQCNVVNKTLLGIAGGSCGVNQAIQAAKRHPEVRTLVLLSDGTGRR
jgi:hypothetical protein